MVDFRAGRWWAAGIYGAIQPFECANERSSTREDVKRLRLDDNGLTGEREGYFSSGRPSRSTGHIPR